ncbi:YgaP family membrane protein [Halorubrum pallidum]
MNQNVGSTDKRVRISLGAVLGAVSLATLANATPLPGVAALVFGVAALALLGTAATGTCGLYSLLGVDTCPASAGESR